MLDLLFGARIVKYWIQDIPNYRIKHDELGWAHIFIVKDLEPWNGHQNPMKLCSSESICHMLLAGMRVGSAKTLPTHHIHSCQYPTMHQAKSVWTSFSSISPFPMALFMVLVSGSKQGTLTNGRSLFLLVVLTFPRLLNRYFL